MNEPDFGRIPPPPAPSPAEQWRHLQRRDDADNLNIIAILHYCLGGLTAVCSCVFLFHVAMGIGIITGTFQSLSSGPGPYGQPPGDGGPPEIFGWMMLIMGAVAVLSGWTLGGLTIHAGRCIARRRGFTLIHVIACLNCLNVPLGTALGVFTLVMMSRPTVKEAFGTLPAAQRFTDASGNR